VQCLSLGALVIIVKKKKKPAMCSDQFNDKQAVKTKQTHREEKRWVYFTGGNEQKKSLW
jgi:hypothetical protein